MHNRILGRRNAAGMLAAALLLGGSAASAQTAPMTLSLTLSPMVIEFHSDAAAPASARITVRNNGNVAERIVAQRMDWHTTPDGAIKMEPIGTEGTSSIANYLRLAPEDAVLAPGETKEFALTLDLPANFPATPAAYWGGYFVRALPANGTAMFGPAATVVVYDTIATPVTHVKLTALHVTPETGGATVVAHVLNDGIGYARPSARIVVTQDGRVVSDQTESMAVIFGGAPRTYTKALTGLATGAYGLTMTVDYGGATLLEGTTSFHVK
jgi:hypothetical protein